ncbi:hypothetical protein [Alkalibacillus salilacus]|uniref:ABC-type Fe3+-siderophore transport system permease subunit n=1 Tax=Alkalibacillus salilacus TaxID=284582 RepID=A0ABT9VHC0_9BACI|nr:hypothetical protein [Alkalibacillus salilacus]MDQ0160351.1 ABC-type Fe3+-siderophore transport system permease subunit [Alkalibacillus salilacus]
MNFINWYDWITPTHPFAAIFFGLLVTLFMVFVGWIETRDMKTAVVLALTGTLVTVIGVTILTWFDFYN